MIDNVSSAVPCIVIRDGFGLDGIAYSAGDYAWIPNVIVDDLVEDGDVARVA